MLIRKQGIAGAVALALLVAGCGGGGGGSTTPPAPAPATTSTQTVSGSVNLSTLVGGAAAKAADATAAAASTSATITIRSYDKDGELEETKQILADDKGVFATQLTLFTAEVGGGYIVIDVKSPNTSGWSKRISYTDPADIDINAELRVAQTVVADLSSTLKASTEDGLFRFGVVRYVDGSRKAVAGKAAIAAAKASDGAAGMDLEIDIPAADLPDTDVLKANLLTFDPSDATDAQSFPGDYLDEFGNRLVSVAFDSIEITDDAGNSVSELASTAIAAGKVSKAASTGVTVRRWIPSGTCASVNDFWTQDGHSGVDDTGTPVVAENGNNIPIYTYNPIKGSWDLLGTGTVQSYSTDTGEYADVATFDNTACLAGAYYLNIAISSEDYINAWWNLDYPLLTSEPTEVCVDVTFQDASAAKLSGIYAELSGTGITRVSGSSRSNGALRLSSVVTGSSTPTSGTVNYWNPYDYSYETVSSVPVGTTCATHTVTVTKPSICTVTGTVTRSGSPAANEYVWAYSANPYAYGWAYTGTDGTFSANVRCDLDMDFYVGSTKAKSFRVDAIKGADEVTDDGSEVALGTITKTNTAPYAYGYLSSYSVKVGADASASVTAYVYGWDADGAVDYPLNYTVKVDGTAEDSGTIAPADDFKSVSLTGLLEGTHTITADIADQAGATATITVGTVEVVAGNRAPVISYAYASTGSSVRLNRDGSLPGFSLYAHSYDPDGDQLWQDWNCTGCVDVPAWAEPSGSNVSFAGGAGYQAGDVLTFTYEAYDNLASPVTRSVDVTVLAAFNNTPYFTSTSQSATTLTAPGTVDFTAEAADADGDTLSYTWKVGSDVAGTGTSFSLNITTEGIYSVTVEVSDGIATISRTFEVTYATETSDTIIILQ
jgi:hypothetical protein